MNQYLVAVIDSTRARFLTLEPAEIPGVEAGPNLVEHEAMLSPTGDLQGQDLWSTTKTGSNRSAGAQTHAYDDHRARHEVEFERRFANSIASHLNTLIQCFQTPHLILVAEPQILGLMREAIAATLPRNVKVSELAKDLCQFKPHELHEYLANKNLLPAKRPGSFV